MSKARRKILLLEPNYSNKFPPVGLMKLATYHKNRGDEVVFYKGDLNLFVIDRISDLCIKSLHDVEPQIDWRVRKDYIFEYIRHGRSAELEYLGTSFKECAQSSLIEAQLRNYREVYRKGIWEKHPEWDRVLVTTLFTFYWDITVETINFAKRLVKKDGKIQVGGVLATLQPRELEEATGIVPCRGLLDKPGMLDEGDPQIIDELPLDYSILDEIEYKYPMSNAFYAYTTRGCIRKCAFCAVSTLEPQYKEFIPLQKRLAVVRERYGDQKDLLLMDNNVLASERFADIIQDIIDCGFAKGAKYKSEDHLEIAIRNLKAGLNDRAYIRKSQELIQSFYNKLPRGSEESFSVYCAIEDFHLRSVMSSTKENILAAFERIAPIYRKRRMLSYRQRYVDFNQGVDARLFTQEKADLLGKICIRPLRIAFDNLATRPEYEAAIRMSVKAGINSFSNYILYNFKDRPVELYQRLRINVELCKELDVSIYSFPMKYHPLYGEYSHNRDYIGKHWNRKYIRAVQCILNSTKGKVGKGLSFFKKAFGSTEEEFAELLELPELFIIYRFFFEWMSDKHPVSVKSWREAWAACKRIDSDEEWARLMKVIHANSFHETVKEQFSRKEEHQLLDFYILNRCTVIDKNSQFYRLKCEYDANPTISPKRKRNVAEEEIM